MNVCVIINALKTMAHSMFIHIFLDTDSNQIVTDLIERRETWKERVFESIGNSLVLMRGRVGDGRINMLHTTVRFGREERVGALNPLRLVPKKLNEYICNYNLVHQ